MGIGEKVVKRVARTDFESLYLLYLTRISILHGLE